MKSFLLKNKTYIGTFIVMLITVTVAYRYNQLMPQLEYSIDNGQLSNIFYSTTSRSYNQNDRAQLIKNIKANRPSIASAQHLKQFNYLKLIFKVKPGQKNRLQGLTLYRPGTSKRTIYQIAATNIVPLEDLENLKRDGMGLSFTPATQTVQFEVYIDWKQPTRKENLIPEIFTITLLLTFLIALANKNRSILTRATERTIRGVLILATGLVLAMSIVTKYDSHPDENSHTQVMQYYTKHTLPPSVGAPGTEKLYSVFGVSYSDEWDIVYILAGKLKKIVIENFYDSHISYRMFNVALFLILAIWALRSQDMILASLLVITPQLWYIFSYTNNDALPLFIGFLLMYCFYRIESSDITQLPLFNKFSISAGILAGTLLISKQTFWVLLLFIFCRVLYTNRRDFRDLVKLKRITAFWLTIGGIALATASPRIAWDIHVNGLNKQQKRLEYSRVVAHPRFDQTKPLNAESYRGLNLRGQGLKFGELFSVRAWHLASFASFVGVYGYNNLHAPLSIYLLFALLLIFLAMAFILYLLRYHSSYLESLPVILIFFAFTAFIILLSAYHSWTGDFQPQGRYFFAVIPLLYFHLLRYREGNSLFIMRSIIALLALLSLYSFAFTGLVIVPKY